MKIKEEEGDGRKREPRKETESRKQREIRQTQKGEIAPAGSAGCTPNLPRS